MFSTWVEGFPVWRLADLDVCQVRDVTVLFKPREYSLLQQLGLYLKYYTSGIDFPTQVFHVVKC